MLETRVILRWPPEIARVRYVSSKEAPGSVRLRFINIVVKSTFGLVTL